METFTFDPRYRPDAERVIERYRALWNVSCIDRPVVHLSFPRDEPLTPMAPIPEYSDPVDRHVGAEFRLARTENWLKYMRFFGDTIPMVSPGLNVAYTATMADAVVDYAAGDWIQPTVEDWDRAPEPVFDPEAPLMRRCIATSRALAENAAGRYIVGSPDYVDCVTTMAQMRGDAEFSMDLMDEPEKVIAYRDRFVKAYLDSATFWNEFVRSYGYPGITNWTGALSPEFGNQVQCDFCVMIGPDMFRWLVRPEIESETEFFGQALFHLDGPGADKHLDALLEIPRIKIIQWVPVAGSDKPTTAHWIPLLKRIQDAGKGLQIYARADEIETYCEHLRPEGLMLHFNFTQQPNLRCEADCEALMKRIEQW